MGNAVIYRPAYDAEVEYLESDGNSYIDTGLKASSELGILAEIQNTSDSSATGWAFGGSNASVSKDFGFIVNGSIGESSFRFSDGLMNISTPFVNTVKTTFNNIENHNVLKVGNTTYEAPLSTFTSDFNLYLFTSNRGGEIQVQYANIRIYSFKIYQNSTLIRDFIPVRIGQVGYMYDKVSKQLFANKGTGNFILGNDVSNAVIPQQRCVLYFGSQRSVGFERIYEEYEWLCGDGSAYINTNVSDLSTIESIYCYFIGNGIETQRVFGRDNKGHSRFVTQQAYNQIRVYTDGDLSTDLVSPNNEEGYILIDYKNATAETKYSQGTIVKNTITTGPNLILFGNNWGTSISNFFTGKIHKFEIKNILSFIPCKLTHGIPASMDANCISRPAGTCGMWDKVNDKFYGNVANSGSFSVENDAT